MTALEVVLAIYVGGFWLVLLGSIMVVRQGPTYEGRKTAARVAVFSPFWPVLIVLGVAILLRLASALLVDVWNTSEIEHEWRRRHGD